MLKLEYSATFRKDYKRLKKRKYDLTALHDAIELLSWGHPLPASYHDHPLVGDYIGCRECHIAPDWLLVYEVIEDKLILYLTRTGTHSDIFA